MSRGRPTEWVDELLSRLDGSEGAKEKMRVLLDAYASGKSIEEACEALGVQRSRLFELKDQAFQGMLSALEPKPQGRPSEAPSEECAQIALLEERVRRLTMEKEAAEIRAEIAQWMPNLLRAEKKTGPRPEPGTPEEGKPR